LIVNYSFGLYPVTAERYSPHLLFNTNSNGLLLCLALAAIPNYVVLENQIIGLPSNTDTGNLLAFAIVLDDVFLQTIAMRCHWQRLIAEEYAVLMVHAYLVAADEIVGVLVPDGNAVSAVALENIVLEQSMPDAPAQEQAISAVVASDTVAHGRTLGAAPRVYAKKGITLRDTAKDRDIIGLLEADPVAVIVSHLTALNECPEPPVQTMMTSSIRARSM